MKQKLLKMAATNLEVDIEREGPKRSDECIDQCDGKNEMPLVFAAMGHRLDCVDTIVPTRFPFHMLSHARTFSHPRAHAHTLSHAHTHKCTRVYANALCLLNARDQRFLLLSRRPIHEMHHERVGKPPEASHPNHRFANRTQNLNYFRTPSHTQIKKRKYAIGHTLYLNHTSHAHTDPHNIRHVMA